MTYYEKNKDKIKKYYEDNKDKVNSKRLKLYYYQKECSRLRNILLDI